MAGQSIMDRVVAAKHSITGQGLAKSVRKATTEEIIGPKKKHLDYLLQCTNEPNVSIPQMADLLIERTQDASWVVVFKALVSIHNLMNYGNERFTQYLASNNCSFNLSGFVDKGGVQGYDMSTYIRRYAKYLNEKAVSYRLMAFDFCKVKRGKDDGLLRTMNTEKLLKTLPILQQQLDALLEFDCTPNELTNGVITACFMLLFKDLIRLFACYNDGIINLLEKYFDMNKKQCKDGLDLYKKFLVRMDKVSEFLKVAENMGIDKGDIPDLAKDDGQGFQSLVQKAPASLLDALEQHLNSLEGKKGAATTPTSASKPAGFTSALNTMTTNTFSVSEAEKKRILDEENQHLQKLKAADETQPSVETEGGDAENIFEQKLKEGSSPQQTALGGTAAANNPFVATSPTSTSQASNLFGSPTEPVAPSGAAGAGAGAGSARPSDDLLSLTGNPFVENVQNVMASAYPQTSNNPFGASDFQSNGYTAQSTGNAFTSEADFAQAFNGGTNTQAGAGFGATTTMAPVAKAPPVGLDLGPPVDLLEGSGGMAPSPSPGLPTDFGGVARQPSPVPASQALGPFAGLESADTMQASPSPSPVGSFGVQTQGMPGQSPMGMDAGLFGGPGMGTPMSMGMGGPVGSPGSGFYGQQSTMGAGMMGSPGMRAGPPGYYQAQGQTMPVNIPGAMGPRPPMGVVAPGSPSLGVGGSPVRIMTRGGKSPATSVSSSPSGPGLEDAVKALGLTRSPAKGSAGKPATKPGSRPLSPGQPMMGGGGGGAGMCASPAAGTEPPGGYSASGEMGGVGGQPPQSYGTQDQEVASSGQGMPAPSGNASNPTPGFDAFGDVLQPMNKSSPSQTPQSTPQGKPMGKDLDSSLASLASNLNVRGGATATKKDHQWQPKGESKLTGGNAFQRQPVAQSTTTPWTGGAQPGFAQPNMMGAPGAPMMYNQPMAGQWGVGQPMGMGMGVQQPGMGMQAPGIYPGAQRMPMMGSGFQQPRPQQPPGQSSNVNDPFGAL